MSYILRTPYGPICSVCQSPLGCEEDDWDECDTCGGEGWPEQYSEDAAHEDVGLLPAPPAPKDRPHDR